MNVVVILMDATFHKWFPTDSRSNFSKYLNLPEVVSKVSFWCVHFSVLDFLLKNFLNKIFHMALYFFMDKEPLSHINWVGLS